MSQAIAPRPSDGSGGTTPPAQGPRLRKISTACGACKVRKTRCTGGHPCSACASRNSACVYDATSDQRRKIANQRNVQDLADAHTELYRQRELLGGIIATIRAGDHVSYGELIRLIRSEVDLSQLAAYVRNECRTNLAIQNAYESINFIIDGGDHLASSTQMLGQYPLQATTSRGSDSEGDNNTSYMNDVSMSSTS